MPTPSIVPNIDGDGSIGTPDKRWASGNFSGHINVRGQHPVLKYFVADSGTRYALTGLGSGLRPNAGDLIFQFSPTGLFIVLDETLLGSESGYRPFGQTLTEIFTAPTINGPVTINGTVTLTSGNTGRVLVLDSGKNIAYSTITSGELFYLSGATGNIQAQINSIPTGFAPLTSPVFITQITTPVLYVTGLSGSIVPYIDNSGKLTSSNVTIADFNRVSGATGNLQVQINSLRSGLMTTGAWPVLLDTYSFASGSGSSPFISFYYTFGAIPRVIGTLRNNGTGTGDPILGCEISGLTASGFYLVLTASAPSNNYRFDYLATTGSGLLNMGFGDPNVVYTTGDQNISGLKLFLGNVSTDSLYAVVDTDIRIDVANRKLYDSGPTPTVDWAAFQLLNGPAVVDWNTLSLSGSWNSNGLKINGKVVPSGSGTVNKIVLWGAQSGLADSVIAQSGSKIGIGTQTPRAFLHLPSGGAGAESAPLKFTSGNLMTTGEPGALEWTSTGLFFTDGATGRSAIVTGGPYYLASNPSNYSVLGTSLPFVGIASNSPATGTTYYIAIDANVAQNTVYDNAKIEIPRDGTLKRFWLKVRIAGTLGATGLVQHFIRLNDTTDIFSGNMQYTGSVMHLTVTGSQAVSAGDYIAIKQITPAWTGLPTTVRYYGTVYME